MRKKDYSLMGIQFWSAETTDSFHKVFKYNEYLRKTGSDISYKNFLKMWKKQRKDNDK